MNYNLPTGGLAWITPSIRIEGATYEFTTTYSAPLNRSIANITLKTSLGNVIGTFLPPSYVYANGDATTDPIVMSELTLSVDNYMTSIEI